MAYGHLSSCSSQNDVEKPSLVIVTCELPLKVFLARDWEEEVAPPLPVPPMSVVGIYDIHEIKFLPLGLVRRHKPYPALPLPSPLFLYHDFLFLKHGKIFKKLKEVEVLMAFGDSPPLVKEGIYLLHFLKDVVGAQNILYKTRLPKNNLQHLRQTFVYGVFLPPQKAFGKI